MAKKAYKIGPGIADYPHLTVPDTKFNKNGVYKTGLVLSGAAAEKAKALVDDAVEQAFKEKTATLTKKEAKAAERYYPYEIDKDSEGNPTGFIKFLCKQNARIPLKEKDPKTGKMYVDMKPIIKNAKDKVVKNVDIWSGSTLNVMVSPRAIILPPPPRSNLPYSAGVQLSLIGVQIIDLKTGGGSSANFGETEGYDGEGSEEAPEDNAAADEGNTEF
jgi:hypothetical protein